VRTSEARRNIISRLPLPSGWKKRVSQVDLSTFKCVGLSTFHLVYLHH
jgi:hypothetical protein